MTKSKVGNGRVMRFTYDRVADTLVAGVDGELPPFREIPIGGLGWVHVRDDDPTEIVALILGHFSSSIDALPAEWRRFLGEAILGELKSFATRGPIALSGDSVEGMIATMKDGLDCNSLSLSKDASLKATRRKLLWVLDFKDSPSIGMTLNRTASPHADEEDKEVSNAQGGGTQRPKPPRFLHALLGSIVDLRRSLSSELRPALARSAVSAELTGSLVRKGKMTDESRSMPPINYQVRFGRPRGDSVDVMVVFQEDVATSWQNAVVGLEIREADQVVWSTDANLEGTRARFAQVPLTSRGALVLNLSEE